MAETGYSWLVAIDTAESQGSPSWTDLPEQTTCDVEMAKEKADITSKSSGGWTDSLETRRQISLTCEGLQDDDNAAIIYLVSTNFHDAGDAERRIHVRLTNLDGDTWVFWASLDSLSLSAPENDGVKFSFSASSRLGPAGEKPTHTQA